MVREHPSAAAGGAQPGAVAAFAAYTRASAKPSRVPTTTVDSKVHSYALTAPLGARTSPARLAGRVRVTGGSTWLTSTPEPVTGYGAVGVTWAHGVQVPQDQLGFQARTRTDGTWSKWLELSYDADHGPDPGSAEARHARPGTDVLLIGKVDQVQVRARAAHRRALPVDMRLAVVDPGKAAHSAPERAALDTGTMDGSSEPAAATSAPAGSSSADSTSNGSDAASLSAAVYTPKPVIYSRAQWGADERMRDKSSLHYYEVHAGFVHHTVNANNYTRAEVPGIIRSIYAYHTQSRGWSDIGYNFVVDRFGRIWEGRYGGVDRPVVGAHTLNYNDYAFAMSAIGNYDITRPSKAMVQAYGALFAWKLSLHGVDASSTKQWVGSRYFEAINGHRDAAATACPGRYLYAKIPRIRKLAAAAQQGWSGRELESDLASTPYPDLIVRRASDGQGVIIPTGGMTGFEAPERIGITDADLTVATPDVTGDGQGDLVVRSSDGVSRVYPGNGAGAFGDPIRPSRRFATRDLVTAVGDFDGDGRNDVVARRRGDGRLELYRGNGHGGFKRTVLATGWSAYDAIAATGDLDGDGHPDLLARDDAGHLWRFPGLGRKLGTPVEEPGRWGQYTTLTGYGDFNGDGHGDLLVAAKGKSGRIRTGRADGTFAPGIGMVTKVARATAVTAADLTGSAAPDLVTTRSSGLQLLPNTGHTELGRPIETGMNLKADDLVLNAGDWNRDGHGDIIVRIHRTGALKVRLGDGEGHFGHPRTIGKGFRSVGLLAAVGDMTGDGWPDLMGQPRGGAMRIYPGNGTSGLKASYVAHGAISAGSQVAVGRWDGDGAPDSLFRSGNKLSLYPGNGPGGLTNPEALGLNLSRYDWVVGISDENLTGHPDLVVRARKNGRLWLIPGTTNGFGKRRYLGDGMGAYDLAG